MAEAHCGALELVSVQRDGNLSANEESLAALTAIDGPLSVVAIAGPQRSGKSFLMNCLAEGSARSTPLFQVGPNVHACTKGLWMWVGAAPNGARTIFLDTEGLGAVKASQHTDLRTFGLSVLLSSLFIFNTTGAIDEAAIKQLSFISKISKAIHIRADVRPN